MTAQQIDELLPHHNIIILFIISIIVLGTLTSHLPHHILVVHAAAPVKILVRTLVTILIMVLSSSIKHPHHPPATLRPCHPSSCTHHGPRHHT